MGKPWACEIYFSLLKEMCAFPIFMMGLTKSYSPPAHYFQMNPGLYGFQNNTILAPKWCQNAINLIKTKTTRLIKTEFGILYRDIQTWLNIRNTELKIESKIRFNPIWNFAKIFRCFDWISNSDADIKRINVGLDPVLIYLAFIRLTHN